LRNNIRLLRPERELEQKNLSFYNFVYVNSTTQKGDQTKDFFPFGTVVNDTGGAT
jgi:hypothetical protein